MAFVILSAKVKAEWIVFVFLNVSTTKNRYWLGKFQYYRDMRSVDIILLLQFSIKDSNMTIRIAIVVSRA